MLELILGVLLAAGAAYYVLRPILRPPEQEPALGDEGDDPDDDMSPRAVAVRALREIEFDHATGKLSDADHDALKAKYTDAAVAAMRGQGGPPSRAPLTAHRVQCPVDGPRPEPDAVFCSTCGRRLGEGGGALGYCVRCGGMLEAEARYCNRCGARVAA